MGEFDLIARYFTRPPRHATLGVGDDCALLSLQSGMQLAVSSDMLVQGRHFLSTTPAAGLGHKALAVNLSDLAACGAKPLAFTLALALPSIDEPWLAGFSKGLWDLADAHGCELIGGDTTQGPLNICITVLGEVPPGDALLRQHAQVGDDIYISGTVGDARLALEVFKGTVSLEAAHFEAARLRMDRPTPRVELGLALRGVANAAVDISDGLLGDLGHILQRSKVGAVIETAWVQDSAAISDAMLSVTFNKRLDFALAGGDDYELLFTASPDQADEVLEAGERCGVSITCIGRITPVAGVQVLDLQGLPLSRRFASFEHFAH
ncbi:MAG: thiamine-phosphate kinase [Burkholderiaceae bacterium]|jgi:thiamine-monophosphate kinase|nr:thiamine-phosphate kinase [Burkholderiaceae bacterium]